MTRRELLLTPALVLRDRIAEDGWLAARQSPDGGWRSQTYGLLRSGRSLTPFAMLSLRDRRAAGRGLAFLAKHPQAELPDYPNYATALSVLALCKLGRATEAAPRVRYLLSRQFSEADGWRESDAAYGGWGIGGDRRSAPNAGHVDLSMTRYVLQALRAAGETGACERAREFLARCQNQDGGFCFSPVVLDANKAGDGVSYGTATADGVISLIAAGVTGPRLAAAKAWLLAHHRPDAAPGFHGDACARWPQGLRYYYAAASAEAFRLLRIARDLDQDRLLRAERRPDGSWANREPLVKEDDPIIATGFALQALC